MTEDSSSGRAERDTITLARRLIACRSVTPDQGGCLDMVASRLAAAGFACERLDRGGVSNLWARLGEATPLVCLAGHVDVVPPGPLEHWTSPPFEPEEREGYLYGRGAADMKTSVAAMVTAAERVAASVPVRGSLAVLLTSDEEGDAVNGTRAVVDELRRRGTTIDACILGEPTSSRQLGDTIKNGRRGSLNGTLRIHGVQCHIAYPELGRNPITQALPALTALTAVEWDRGTDTFPPTAFQISNIHGGTGAPNMIPGALEVRFNFRFSPASPAEHLQARVHDVLDRAGLEYDLEWNLSGRPFSTPRGPLIEALAAAIEAATGRTPGLSTSGGTSDGRFLVDVASEVVEFGPVNETIHKVDERVRLADIGPLSLIYERTVAALMGAA